MSDLDYRRGLRDGAQEQLEIQKLVKTILNPPCILCMAPNLINARCVRCGQQINGSDGKPLRPYVGLR